MTAPTYDRHFSTIKQEGHLRLRTRPLTDFDRYKRSMSSSKPIRIPSKTGHMFLGSLPRTSSQSFYQQLNRPPKKSKHNIIRMYIIGLLAIATLCAVFLPTSKAFGRRSLVSSERYVYNSSVRSVIVKQGDTLWSIAQQLEPSQDPRKTVDQLVSARGTANIYVGEVIEWTR